MFFWSDPQSGVPFSLPALNVGFTSSKKGHKLSMYSDLRESSKQYFLYRFHCFYVVFVVKYCVVFFWSLPIEFNLILYKPIILSISEIYVCIYASCIYYIVYL